MPAGTGFVFGVPETGGPLGGDGAETRPSGAYATRDFGATFEPVPDLAGYSVETVVAAPGDPQVMYAAASPLREVRLSVVLKSTDFGRSWTPLPGSLPATPSRIAVDARLPDVVWINAAAPDGAPATGAWRSDDGGLTFTRVTGDRVLDFDTSPIAGGGSRVDMATEAGLIRTRDGGTTFRTVTPEPVAAVTHEKFAPDALMAVVGSRSVRSTSAGRTFKPAPGVGALTGCTVTELTRNEEFPSYFLLSLAGCDSEGHHLYRSDGRDLLNVDDIGGDVEGDFIPDLERLPRTEMRILREFQLPVGGDTSSGSLGFDGEMLYYTNNNTSNQIHVSTTSGEFVRTITVAPEHDVRTLTYDPAIEKFWVMVNKGGQFQFPSIAGMYTLDPVTGVMKEVFTSPLGAETTLSMDPTSGLFRSYQHHGYEVYQITRTGQIVDTCEVPGFPVDPNVSTHPTRGHPDNPSPGFASGVAVGQGRMYLQLEDDRTVFHVSEDCEILAVFEHRTFAESRGGPAGLENDQMTCDTVTFGEPAIWIRDAAPNRAVAYAVPHGYCPLASKLTMTPPQISGAPGADVEACALLLGDGPSGTFMPVGAVDVTFFADDLPVASGVTDDEGLACATFPAPGGGPRTIPLEAAFYGTISFRPSSATGTLVTSVFAQPEPERVVPPPPPPVPPQVMLLFPPLPVPALPAGTAQAPTPQQQPQPQPQQQPQVQAQAGLARQQQQQTQLALAFSSEESGQLSEEYAMSERRDRNARLSLQGAAAVIMLAFGWCVTRG
ncbi:MAG: hypothetical protein M3217_11255, partial [Actinomycetota bacterium]|nr:hypothetical protein [Actinomycetota bacterium]